MADTLNLSIRIDADGQPAIEDIERVEEELRRLRDSLGDQPSDDIDDIGDAARGAQSPVAGLGKALLALGAVEGLRQLGAAMLDAAQQAQDLRTRLDFAAGSAEAGDVAFRSLAGLSAELGVSNSTLVDSFIRLKNLGLDPSNEALEAYANVAAATGKTTNDFVEAVADAITGEFERLKEFGVKASVEGDQVALKFQGQTRLIANDAASIEAALQSIGQVEFAGAVAAQADNLSVSLSQLGDNVDLLLAKMATESGVVETTTEWAKALSQLAATLAADTVPQLQAAEQHVTALQAAMSLGWDAIEKSTNPVKTAVGALNDALLKAVGAITETVYEAKNLGDTSAQTAQRTAELAGELDAQATAAADLTEQQRMLIEQNAWLGESVQSAADALAEQQAAQQAAAQSAADSLIASANLARAYGDEERAVSDMAKAKQILLDLATQQHAAAAAELADAQQALAALREQTTATGGQIAAATEAVNIKRQASAEAQAAAAAAQTEAAAARLAADTYGDQSGKLAELASQYQALRVASEANTAAIEAGTLAALQIAAAQADAEQKAAAYAQALLAGSETATALAQESQIANDTVALLTEQIAAGEAAQQADLAIKQQLADAAAKLKDAYDDMAAAIDREIASMQRDTEIAQARIELQIKQLEREQALAQAKGDTAKAAQTALDIAKLEVSAAQESATAQYAVAEALAQKADNAERAALADGTLTDAERDMIDQLRDAAEMAKIEAESLDVSTQSKQDNATAAKEAAAATRDQAAASSANAQALRDEADAIASKNSAADSASGSSDWSGKYKSILDPQTLAQQFYDVGTSHNSRERQLKEYLESWMDIGGFGQIEYMRKQMADVKAIWADEEGRTSAVGTLGGGAKAEGETVSAASETSELSSAAQSLTEAAKAMSYQLGGATKTVKLEFDGSTLFGDEANVEAFLTTLQKAGLRAF